MPVSLADSSLSLFLSAVSWVSPLFTAVLKPLAMLIFILESCLTLAVPEPLVMRTVLN